MHGGCQGLQFYNPKFTSNGMKVKLNESKTETVGSNRMKVKLERWEVRRSKNQSERESETEMVEWWGLRRSKNQIERESETGMEWWGLGRS